MSAQALIPFETLRATYKKGAEGGWTGAIKAGKRVVWTCDHRHSNRDFGGALKSCSYVAQRMNEPRLAPWTRYAYAQAEPLRSRVAFSSRVVRFRAMDSWTWKTEDGRTPFFVFGEDAVYLWVDASGEVLDERSELRAPQEPPSGWINSTDPEDLLALQVDEVLRSAGYEVGVVNPWAGYVTGNPVDHYDRLYASFEETTPSDFEPRGEP